MNHVNLFWSVILTYPILIGQWTFLPPTSQAGFKEELFCDIIADQFLYENIDGPTHLHGNKLDCVLCNVPELITDVNCVNPTDLFPSDHYLIEFDIKLCFQKAKAVRRTVYDFNNANFNAARDHLLYVPLESLERLISYSYRSVCPQENSFGCQHASLDRELKHLGPVV